VTQPAGGQNSFVRKQQFHHHRNVISTLKNKTASYVKNKAQDGNLYFAVPLAQDSCVLPRFSTSFSLSLEF
jgi:hypothetical protein